MEVVEEEEWEVEEEEEILSAIGVTDITRVTVVTRA